MTPTNGVTLVIMSIITKVSSANAYEPVKTPRSVSNSQVLSTHYSAQLECIPCT